MKEWFTAQEIADAGLPDLPTTKRGVSLLADREGWVNNPAFARTRSQRGGGFEYHYKLWPTLAQVEHQKRHLTISAPVENDLPMPAPISGRGATERDARLAILAAFEQFSRGARLGHKACLQVFSDKYNMRSLAIEGWIVDVVPKISKRSLERWQGAKRAGTFDQLAVDRGKARKGKGVFDLAEGGRLKAFVLALIIEQPHFSADHIRTLCKDEFGATVAIGDCQQDLPPARTFQHAIKRLKEDNRVLIMKATNPDRYRSAMRPRGTGMMRHIRIGGQLWMIDASPVDALCVDGRHSIYIAIDVATRRIVILVSRTPRASAVGLMIRKATLKWGVPQQIKTDNGSDFVAEQTKRLFRHLDIEALVSQKYTPTEKAHVERVIKTFQHQVGPLLPGFIGHNVADRKAIEERKAFAARLGTTDAEAFGVQLTAAELQQRIDDWVEFAYEQAEHSALGISPAMAAASSTSRPRMVNERALDALLMTVPGKDGLRTVTAQGIRLDGYHYGVMGLLPGEQVMVRQDPTDMGRLYAFSPDGTEFMGEAICPELAGVAPAAYWAAVREAHADVLREGSKWMEAERRRIAKGPTFIDRYLRVKRAEASNVVALPKRADTHTTPQISAALAAMDARDRRPTPVESDPAILAEQQRLIAEVSDTELIARHHDATRAHEARVAADAVAALPRNVVALETPKTRYRRALSVMAAMQAGTADAGDALWLGQYQTTAEFKAEQAIHQDFGDVYLT
ncbi:Transposase and inactivated derivative [Devosia sp. DBB001]|nr:Transposase and inactivated derivative [Devosia sp. DBB001]